MKQQKNKLKRKTANNLFKHSRPSENQISDGLSTSFSP
ncbi:hypothetical protein NEIFL0001_1159 [Neisseria flavescens SK114]|nr:hypothetical protein NEIFL0001_1159 [Neisseria flavescens SK114]